MGIHSMVALEAETELLMHLEVPEFDHKRPFYYNVTAGKDFTLTSESSRILMQFEMLLIFRKEDANFSRRLLDPGGRVDGSFCEYRWFELEF